MSDNRLLQVLARPMLLWLRDAKELSALTASGPLQLEAAITAAVAGQAYNSPRVDTRIDADFFVEEIRAYAIVPAAAALATVDMTARSALMSCTVQIRDNGRNVDLFDNPVRLAAMAGQAGNEGFKLKVPFVVGAGSSLTATFVDTIGAAPVAVNTTVGVELIGPYYKAGERRH